jgi:lactate dehydrogenase-like 2-hydroxyacid dehydrogenase
MKLGMMLVNTSRGAVIETRAVIRALKEESSGAWGSTCTRRRPTFSSRISPAV